MLATKTVELFEEDTLIQEDTAPLRVNTSPAKNSMADLDTLRLATESAVASPPTSPKAGPASSPLLVSFLSAIRIGKGPVIESRLVPVVAGGTE